MANDNPFLLEAFKEGLSPHFDLIETAQNGKESVEMVLSHDRAYYAAIILDNDMPVMGGMEACVLMKKYLSEEIKNSPPSSQ